MSANNRVSNLIESQAFVYCWTDHKTNKLYIGSHKGTEDDGYVCSSKLMMEQYRERSQDFTRQIIASGTFEDMRTFEYKLLVACGVRNNPTFYNQSTGCDKFFVTEKTESHRKKISETLTGRKMRPRSEETIQKMRKPKSEQQRQKLLGNQNAKGAIKSPETIEKLRLANLGRKNTEHGINNLRLGQKKRYENPEQRRVQSVAAILGWETRRKNLNVGK